MKTKNDTTRNIILVLIVIALAVVPLFIQKDAEFGGSDDQAEGAITEIRKDYEPWFEPIMEPKSGEIESLLFALQASIGSAVIFYGIGYMKGKSKVQTVASEDGNR